MKFKYKFISKNQLNYQIQLIILSLINVRPTKKYFYYSLIYLSSYIIIFY